MSTSKGSDFLALPADIRNIIYEFVFTELDGVHLDFASYDQPLLPPNSFALAETCRQIRNESRSLPFWLNTFHFNLPLLSKPKACPPMTLPLPPPPRAARKMMRTEVPAPVYDLVARRKEARDFITANLRMAHVEGMLERLDEVLERPGLIGRMRKIYIHLGAQVDKVSIQPVARFVAAWMRFVPLLRRLSALTAVQVSWKLNVSRRWLMECEWGVEKGLVYKLIWMGDWLDGEEKLTPAERDTVDCVRDTVRETME